MKQIYFISTIVLLWSIPAMSDAQKTYVDGDYVVFDASTMNPKTYKIRVNDATFASNGHVKRVISTHEYNKYTSKKFRIAPTDIDPSGGTNEAEIEKGTTWATAAGWSVNANTLPVTQTTDPLDTGCPNYLGKDNDPTEKGKWRLPSITELIMIWIYQKAIFTQATQAGLTYYKAMNTHPVNQVGKYYYLWYTTYTEVNTGTSGCLDIEWRNGTITKKTKDDSSAGPGIWDSGAQNLSRRIRCISDIP